MQNSTEFIRDSDDIAGCRAQLLLEIEPFTPELILSLSLALFRSHTDMHAHTLVNNELFPISTRKSTTQKVSLQASVNCLMCRGL